jgi:fatty acid desaturase
MQRIIASAQQQAATDGSAAEQVLLLTGRLSDYLSSAEIATFNNFSSTRIVRDAILIWAAILGCLALSSYWQNIPVFALCFVVIASRQLALTHLVHDACHFRLTVNKKLNDLISDIFFAAPVLISTQQYRAQHLPHHRNLGDSRLDTDRRAWYSIRGWHFVRRSLLILIGWEAAQTFLSYSKITPGEVDKSSGDAASLLRRALWVALTNGLLLAYCWMLGAAWLFFALWVAPLFTLTMYLLTLRVIAEHQTVAYALLGRDDFEFNLTDPLIRTVQPGLLGRFFLGSCNFHYHHEHHLAPAVPYSKLPQLHGLLVARGYYHRYPQALGGSYLATLRGLVFPSRQERHAA